MREIQIGGITPLTTIDFPDHLATVLYCQGCNLRCQYCHNPELIKITSGQYAWQSIQQFLKRRTGLVEAVVFSGGEPLIQNNLVEAIQWCKQQGFKVGIHTSGSIPKRFTSIISLVDWIGFDFKSPPHLATTITGSKVYYQKCMTSLTQLIESKVSYEIRTTINYQLIKPDDLLIMAKVLASHEVKQWVLQPFKSGNILNTALNQQSNYYDLELLLPEIKRYIIDTQIRSY
ncbi:anaerobic ribonucleoside-triphosphate reductase activating protein [Endozoicomonas sp. SM1973]|uniref:Anaerobic ribonucleoside-triphosphate reductase activating protein n=1 Tax=Spartinivicinus marinus TaxID=2994442 RepID=A0A853HW92_9GAMM|nr:anaerobic ribonucleoside-triphosphate reductase activating protein [Spartinivicinus marinus]MCX4025298.1 anaerobic ribonucleoside-triphosphate reductase activating protein [Spartinivicinus marinus]NYZ66020.1 anaerobic ribonucleoside-triphosphate reductase activating protein [Spartinivicinus marinus]